MRGGAQVGLARGLALAAQPSLQAPSTQALFLKFRPNGRPLLVYLGLAGESGVLECNGQRLSLQHSEGDSSFLHLQHLAFPLGRGLSSLFRQLGIPKVAAPENALQLKVLPLGSCSAVSSLLL